MSSREDIVTMHREVLYPTVRVRTQDSGGSGTVVYSRKGEDGKVTTAIITNHHVVEDCIEIKEQWDPIHGENRKKETKQTVYVEYFNYNNYSRCIGSFSVEADIVAYDADQDMALLITRDRERVIEHIANIFPIASIDEVHIFDSVFCVGASLGHAPLPTDGRICFLDDEIDNYKYIMTNCSSLYGSCLVGDTLVSMSDNTVKHIRDIVPGDRVWGVGKKELKQSTVEEIVDSGEKEIFKINTRTRSISASGNHPIATIVTVKDYTGKLKNILTWKQVDALSVGDKIAVLEKLPDREKGTGINFKDVIGQYNDPVEFMKLLGYYIGDGYLRVRPGVSYSVALCDPKQEMRDKYGNIIEKIVGKRPSEVHNMQFELHDKEFTMKMYNLGLMKKSIDKIIPDWVFTQPKHYQEAFIEGYLDSDGYINPIGSWAFECASKSLTYQLRMMFIHIGYNVSNIYYRKKEATMLNGRRVISSGSYAFQAYPQFSKNRSTPIHNVDELEKPDGIAFEMVKSINKVGIERTYDIKLKNTHNFFANGVLVHNSGGAIYRWSNEREKYEYLAIPSRITTIPAGFLAVDTITHMGYGIGIERIMQFIDKNCYQFIYDSNITIEQCHKNREQMKKEEKNRKGRKTDE